MVGARAAHAHTSDACYARTHRIVSSARRGAAARARRPDAEDRGVGSAPRRR